MEIKINVTPVIEIDIEEFRRFIGMEMEEIYEKMDALRLKVKKAANYFWDNQQFRITIYGKEVMNVSFFPNFISVYHHEKGYHIEDFKSFTLMDATILKDFAIKIDKGFKRCRSCGKWVMEGKPYSYAGFVCKECYNPEVHLPPDPS